AMTHHRRRMANSARCFIGSPGHEAQRRRMRHGFGGRCECGGVLWANSQNLAVERTLTALFDIQSGEIFDRSKPTRSLIAVRPVENLRFFPCADGSPQSLHRRPPPMTTSRSEADAPCYGRGR